jgi:nucleotide-binding universal stress UspA family protein
MLPINNILHPTDFSDRSEFAFRLATALARDYHANLVILHVVHEPVVLYTEGVIPAPPEDHLEEMRERLLQLQPPSQDVTVTHRLEEGNPATEILRVAGLIPADLIVMGTHGRRGLNRLLMGSVAEYVLERATCPVLTVKTPFPEEKPVHSVASAELVHS